MANRQRALGIGALSQRTGCNIETIRYYEKIGLMNPGRTAGGHRLFDHGQLKRLSFVMRCRRLGFSVGEIRTLLGLVDGGSLSCAEVKSVTEAHLGEVRQKIADLQSLEGVLAQMVSECSGTEVPDCPIIDTLYAAA
ncbi:MAG: helix-turn-helix domain-containing protein [Rhodospirillales bacterium]|jgi:MerR family mercuric resistance operon transcriptional regulator|nr:transcriptional regulator [Rhodospirillaceae bacterium]MDP6428286.1 helix-turn-helix domain-containing protein [Rhodospirillales bacterium]MDP6646151.1 helix-turn-helix domain-containing protein [Rhodospirillales bacterium]MDP6840700.1 helix-turn-helix domain-containing protein [Rhodospirillales bacterium]